VNDNAYDNAQAIAHSNTNDNATNAKDRAKE
jgi:hypothetical protein